MNKQAREKNKELKLVDLIGKTEAINAITAEAEPFVKEYWSILVDLWKKPVGYNEAERIKAQLGGGNLKELNKSYKNLLK